jgi:putative cardiolipin synthase
MAIFARNTAITAAGMILLIGCQTRRVDTRSNRAGTTDTSTTTTTNTSISTPTGTSTVTKRSHDFGILDGSIDFVPDNTEDAKALLAKFPIRDKDTEIADLAGGPEFLAARWDMLNKATKSVRLQTLVFHGDESGWLIARKLVELKNRGVSVRIIIDGVSNLYPEDQGMFLYLQQNGIKVEGYDLVYLYVLQEIGRSATIDSIIDRTNMRYHEKMFIVDAEDPANARAIVGGVNIANKYFRIDRTKPDDNWQDKDVIVRGSLVADIAKSFDENLKYVEEFRSRSALANTTPLWKWAISIRDILKLKPIIPNPEPDLRPAMNELVKTAANTPLNLDWHPVRGRFLKSRPYLKEQYIHFAYLDAIKSAKKSIHIMNSYFLPTNDVRAALKDAVRRGVEVKILANDVGVADYESVMKASRLIYPELLGVNRENPKAKLSIYEWGGDPIFKNGYGLHHGKYAIFDDRVSIVGSYNIDPRSKNLNSESVVVFEQEKLATKLNEQFTREIGAGFATNITYEVALKFRDPDGFLKILEARFLEALSPIF